jgi:hypothetical protein
MQTTPKKINSVVRQFSRELGGTPRYVPVSPLTFCEHMRCFLNVWEAVKCGGGKAIYGWIIWLDPKRMIDAEYHAVWETPDGKWYDITPTVDGEASIVFVSTGETPNSLTQALLDAIRQKEADPTLPPVDGPKYLTPNRTKYLPRG